MISDTSFFCLYKRHFRVKIGLYEGGDCYVYE